MNGLVSLVSVAWWRRCKDSTIAIMFGTRNDAGSFHGFDQAGSTVVTDLQSTLNARDGCTTGLGHEHDTSRMPWAITTIPGPPDGAYLKILRHDADTGEVLFLLGCVPGWDYAKLEYHDVVETGFARAGHIWLEGGATARAAAPVPAHGGEVRPLADLEREAILHALEVVGGNRRRAAELLGIGERTLYDRLKKYGVDQ